MMSSKKLWRVAAIVDHAVLHELMLLLDGKCVGQPDIMPVRHAGPGNNGELRPPPTTRDFILNFMAERGPFVLKDVVPIAEKYGISKGALAQTIYKLMSEKIVKRQGKGIYILNEAKIKKVPAAGLLSDGRRKPSSTPAPGESMKERIFAFVQSKQNGSGEGVALDDIKEHIVSHGFQRSGVNSELDKLVNKEKKMVRVARSLYRAVIQPQQPHAHQ